jgi:hypothetical protein
MITNWKELVFLEVENFIYQINQIIKVTFIFMTF